MSSSSNNKMDYWTCPDCLCAYRTYRSIFRLPTTGFIIFFYHAFYVFYPSTTEIVRNLQIICKNIMFFYYFLKIFIRKKEFQV